VFSHGQSSKLETLSLISPTRPGKLSVQAWVPEDFNLDVHTRGSITGVNMKDTKLISKGLELISEEGDVRLRRARNDRCLLVAERGSIDVGSYVESGQLEIRTGSGDISVTKRLGIVKSGKILS
jgi:hypothetical protein